MAKRLRRYTAKVGAITIPASSSRRYQDQRNVLSCIAAVVILIFFIPYTASGFKAIGTLFNSLFGVDYHTTMIIGAPWSSATRCWAGSWPCPPQT